MQSVGDLENYQADDGEAFTEPWSWYKEWDTTHVDATGEGWHARHHQHCDGRVAEWWSSPCHGVWHKSWPIVYVQNGMVWRLEDIQWYRAKVKEWWVRT